MPLLFVYSIFACMFYESLVVVYFHVLLKPHVKHCVGVCVCMYVCACDMCFNVCMLVILYSNFSHIIVKYFAHW